MLSTRVTAERRRGPIRPTHSGFQGRRPFFSHGSVLTGLGPANGQQALIELQVASRVEEEQTHSIDGAGLRQGPTSVEVEEATPRGEITQGEGETDTNAQRRGEQEEGDG